MMSAPFKTCGNCGTVWPDRSAFLSDSTIRFVGYQVDFANPEPGFFLFNHEIDACGTTLAVKAGHFKDMSPHAVNESSSRSGGAAPRDCLYVSSGEPCPHRCECFFVKDVCGILHHVRTAADTIQGDAPSSRQIQEAKE